MYTKYAVLPLLHTPHTVCRGMEVSLPEGEWLEEISSDALDRFVQNQSGYAEGFVRFMPSGQVIEKHDFGTSVRHSSGRRLGVAVWAVDCWQ